MNGYTNKTTWTVQQLHVAGLTFTETVTANQLKGLVEDLVQEMIEDRVGYDELLITAYWEALANVDWQQLADLKNDEFEADQKASDLERSLNWTGYYN